MPAREPDERARLAGILSAAVREAGGYVAESDCGAGVYEALLHFVNGAVR